MTADIDLEGLARTVTDEGGITREQAYALAGLPEDRLPDLLALADRVRRDHAGEDPVICGIVNMKSGGNRSAFLRTCRLSCPTSTP